VSDTITERLATMRSTADLDSRAGAPVGNALRTAVAALEAVASTEPSRHDGPGKAADCAHCAGEEHIIDKIRVRLAAALSGGGEAE
jgi:hypothetical protein